MFHWHNLPGRTMALGSTKPLSDEYHEYFLEGEGGRCVGLTTLPPSCADCLEIWEPQPPGTPRASNGTALLLPYSLCSNWMFLLLVSAPGNELYSTVQQQVCHLRPPVATLSHPVTSIIAGATWNWLGSLRKPWSRTGDRNIRHQRLSCLPAVCNVTEAYIIFSFRLP